MGIDWSQMLSGMQQGVNQPNQPSLFPSTPWSNLASIIRAVGVGMAVPKAKAQTDMTNMLNTAKMFGLPGIRQLYADPKFQQLAKTTGVTLPDLPPLSPEELTAQRQQDFIKEAQQRADAMAGAQGTTAAPTQITQATPTGSPFSPTPGMPVTPATQPGSQQDVYQPTVTADQLPSASWRKIYSDLALKYPDAAQSLGIVQPIAPGVMSTLIRSMTDYRTDPQTAMRAIDAAFSAAGYDPSNLPPEVRAEATAQAGQYASLFMQNMQAQYFQRLESGNLSKARIQDLENSFNTRMDYYQARINDANANGNYHDAMTAVADMNAEWTPKLDQARIDNLEATGAAATSRAATYRMEAESYGPLRSAEAQYYIDRGQYMKAQQSGNTLPALKAQETAITTLIHSSLSRITQLQNAPLAKGYTEQQREEDIQTQTQELNGYIGDLKKLRQQIATSGPTKPGPDQHTPPANPYGELNQQFQSAFNTLARNNDTWTGDSKTVAAKLAKQFQYLKTLPGAPTNGAQWDAFWRALQYHAKTTYNLDIPDTP